MKTTYQIYKEYKENNWSKEKYKQELINNGAITRKCAYHDLEFIGDGLWKCKNEKCGLIKTDNIPLGD